MEIYDGTSQLGYMYRVYDGTSQSHSWDTCIEAKNHSNKNAKYKQNRVHTFFFHFTSDESTHVQRNGSSNNNHNQSELCQRDKIISTGDVCIFF